MQWFHTTPGWFNLWILVLAMNLLPVLIFRLRRPRNEAALQRAVTLPEMHGWERIAYWAVMIPYFSMFGYALFVPFSDEPILLLVGGILLVFAVGLRTKAMIDYAQTESGQLITQGVYQVSRNPGYFAAMLALLSLGILGESLLMIAVALYFFIGYQWVSTLEERFCAQHWPEAFPMYKRQVARNFLFF